MVFIALIAGTFVSEDLACITAGLLVQQGRIGLLAGTASCAAGIVLGDIGLWLAGRFSGTVAARWPLAGRQLSRLPIGQMRRWLVEHAATAILVSRFLPGTRLPLYLTAGLVRMPLTAFALWTSVAAAIWTPLIVLLASHSGGAAIEYFSWTGIDAWVVHAATAAVLLLLLTAARPLAARLRHRAVAARLARWSRWEFWPMWLFYPPVAVWVVLLALRYRGFNTLTASNPGIPDGGVVGESKHAILCLLPRDCTIASTLIPSGHADARAMRLLTAMHTHDWSLPIVLKPDAGQRGTGVRLVRTVDDLHAYFAGHAGPVLAQPYHPGPFEAGVFYYRMPGWARGRILSITDKEFPSIVGDGRSTIEALIWSHQRYRMQANLFLERHRAVRERVLQAGERLQLGIAGNHAQGAIFRDGRHLWTPALERRIDDIARSYPGFYVGRFDVRYSDVDAFKAGRDLAIVELNGATAESTDIYDPDRSLVSAYRQLFRQWSIVFAIGAANRDAGAPVSSMRRLVALLRDHLFSAPMDDVPTVVSVAPGTAPTLTGNTVN